MGIYGYGYLVPQPWRPNFLLLLKLTKVSLIVGLHHLAVQCRINNA